MRNHQPWHNAWTSIDKTSDPSWFVRFLDESRISVKKSAESNPKQYFTFLNLQPGQRILEVGYGTGDITRLLAQLVENSEVIGVDSSETMVSEARKRAQGLNLPLRFEAGDVHNLQFEDEAFDRSYANAVFQHIENPHLGLSEMIRVTKMGGQIVIADHDWETFVVSSDNDIVSHKMIQFFHDSIRNGSIAHHLPILFRDFGLTGITVEPHTEPMFSPTASLLEMLVNNAHLALIAGKVSESEANQWVASMSKRNQEGRLFAAFTIFRVSGIKSQSKQ